MSFFTYGVPPCFVCSAPKQSVHYFGLNRVRVLPGGVAAERSFHYICGAFMRTAQFLLIELNNRTLIYPPPPQICAPKNFC